MTRNYIAFAILSALVLGGWFFVESRFLRPPRPKKDADTAEKKEEEKKQEAKQLPLTARQKRQVSLAAWAVGVRGQLPFDGSVWNLALEPEQIARTLDQPPPPPIRPKSKVELVADDKLLLGGEGYHLEAQLTQHGAGVRRVTLRHFKSANYLGLPTDRVFDLIPDDPIQPSFLMHHYADPAKPGDHPVLGLGDEDWKFEGQEKRPDGVQEVRFSTHLPNNLQLKVTKTYRLMPTDYHLGLELRFDDERERTDAEPSTVRYQLTGGHGLPIEGEWYTSTFRNGVTLQVDRTGFLWRDLEDSGRISLHQGGDRVPPATRTDSFLQYAGVTNQFFASVLCVDDKQPSPDDGGVDQRDILAWARPTQESTEKKCRFLKAQGDDLIVGDLETNSLAFFRLLPHVKRHLEELDLEDKAPIVVHYYETPGHETIATWVRRGHALRPQLGDITNRVTSEMITLKPGRSVVHQFLLYHGPVKTMLLGTYSGEEAVPPELVNRYVNTLNLRTLTDYRSAGPVGWFSERIYFTHLIILFTRLMHWLLEWLHVFVPSYGLSIILLTVLVRGAMFPISRRQAIFSVKMQQLAPEMKKIAEKYKDDPQGRTQATMEIYRKHNIHPLGSCLPMLMQMPIFLGLYFALQESIHFRLAPFLWIRNLAAPDMLFWWSEKIPWISDPDSQGSMFYLGPFFNLLPVLAVALMIVQQQLLTPPPTDEQQEAQQKMMKYMMIFFGVLFYKVAAGLSIYFISSSLWGLAERRMLPKKSTAAAVEPASNGPTTAVRAGAPPRKPNKGGRLPKPEKKPETMLDRLRAWAEDVLEQARKK